MVVQNQGADELTIDEVTLENGDEISTSDEEDIGVGQSESITLDDGDDLESSDGCNTFDLTFTYDQGDLENLELEGTLTDSIEIDDTT